MFYSRFFQLDKSKFMMAENETKLAETIVRVWNFRSLPLIFLIFYFPIIYFDALNKFWFATPIYVLLQIYIFWWMTFTIRERWRLSLTDKQIVARQLYPRPFTYFTRDNHFPLHTIEGLSIGPKAFKTIFLIGIFISTNLGINLMKSGYSEQGYDLYDPIDAAVLILKEMTFLPFIVDWTNSFENFIIYIYTEVAPLVQRAIGWSFFIIGIIIILITIPRRSRLHIRVRFGKDFRLNAGVPADFWQLVYKEIYKNKIVEAPSEIKKFGFPWLENEYIQSRADLDQTIYKNRILSVFVIFIGFKRLYDRLTSGRPFFETDVIFWAALTLIDILIAFLAIRFSLKKKEMIVTNKRILFTEEERDFSGAVLNRRYYLVSDIERSDVAGFYFQKIKKFSIFYLIAGISSLIFTIYFFSILQFEIKVVAIVFTLFLFSLVYQTYLQFNLNTKGGESWIMKHQLSNPATAFREFTGGEDNMLITTILANRLEEKEIIDVVQSVRSSDLVKPKKYLRDDEMETSKKTLDQFSLGDSKVQFEDLLLAGEERIFSTNVSRKVPRRKLTLTVGSFLILCFAGSIIPILALLTIEEFKQFNVLTESLVFFSIVGIIAMILGIWIKYFTFFKATLTVTPDRVFFQDKKDPPRLLFMLGMTKEIKISETLRNQIHSTYTSRQISQKLALKASINHLWKFILSSICFGILIGIAYSISVLNQENNPQIYLINQAIVIPLILFLILGFGLLMGWNAGNGFVEFIRGWPKRIYNAKGIGVHFIMPYATKRAAEKTNYSIWSGKNKVYKNDQ